MAHDLANNLKILMSSGGLNASALSKSSGIDKARISRLLSGKIINPQVDTLNKIAASLNVSIDQLIGNTPIHLEGLHGQIVNLERLMVPIIPWDVVPLWESIKDNFTPTRTIDTNTTLSENSFALLIESEEYEPRFLKNSIIIVDPALKPKNRHFVLTKETNNNNVSLHQFIQSDDGNKLKKVDLSFELSTLSDEIKIIGVVVEIYFDIDS